MNYKITFVIPVYNKALYIGECLDSVLKQTLKDIEIIIINDGSKDHSQEIIDFYVNKDKCNKRIKVIKFKKNQGRSFVRNYANSKAKSKIIVVQDADDIAVAERAEQIYKYFQKHKIDVFYSGFSYGNEFGTIMYDVPAIPFNYDRVKKDLVTYIGHSTMAYKKNVVNKIKYSLGAWSELGLDDWKLQLDLYKNGYKFGYLNKRLLIYRQLNNSITFTRNNNKVIKLKKRYLLFSKTEK